MERDFYARYFELEERHWWFQARRHILLRVLDRRLVGRTGLALLDLGCGTGRTTQALSRFGTVWGVDADPEAVRFCRERGLAEVQLLTDWRLPFADDSFDLVTALDVIEHVDDDEAIVREVGRVLRPGGTALLTVPAYQLLWGAQDEISHHKRRYRAGQLDRILTASGLRPILTTYFNTVLFPAVAAVRLLRRIRPARGALRSDFEMTPPGRLNAMLTRLFSVEAEVVGRIRLPFGVSILALATKEPATP